jgi:hypothetical protein
MVGYSLGLMTPTTMMLKKPNSFQEKADAKAGNRKPEDDGRKKGTPGNVLS